MTSSGRPREDMDLPKAKNSEPTSDGNAKELPQG